MDSHNSFDLDKALIVIGGWGRFQKLYYLCLCSVIAFSVFQMSYIFVARDIKYRCLIRNCDEESHKIYKAEWLEDAVPFRDNTPSRCMYYTRENYENCTNFNRSITSTCDTFIYEQKQATIVHDFNITCDENLWKLTIVGLINVVGELVCLPFAGFISDRYGRKNMVVSSVVASTIVGITRSQSTSYSMYLALEFLDTALGAGMYSGAFILALEIVDPSKRNIGNTIICCAFAVGQVLLGIAAWVTPSWRYLLLSTYSSGVIISLVFLYTPESVRWLLSKNRVDEAIHILTIISKFNGKNEFNGASVQAFQSRNKVASRENPQTMPLRTIFRSKTLALRIVHCSFTWICCNFPYYGLTIQSVALSEDTYVNFICTAIVEIPAYILTHISLDKLGRRKSLAFSLILAGLSCGGVNLVSRGHGPALVLFLFGKFFMTIAYTTLYIFTVEMFPTKSRHSIFAICSMFGRLGSMLAPQVPLLTRVSSYLPLIIFSLMALSSGLLAFFFPETHNKKLTDEFDPEES